MPPEHLTLLVYSVLADHDERRQKIASSDTRVRVGPGFLSSRSIYTANSAMCS
jgi:hypothetical protein